MTDEPGRADLADLAELRDHEQIRQLKYRYFRFLDTKDWAGLGECFVPEATASYPQQACASREEILAFLTGSVTEEMVTLHQGHHPEIAVDGDAAEATWYLHDKVIVPSYRFCLEGAALYRDRYVRTAAGWRLAHTGYERLYESTWSMDDLPGFKVEQGSASRGASGGTTTG